jgi:hypothetical protein
MSDKEKIIRTVYLYLAALISLIFVAVGTGTVMNSLLKYKFFSEAEKKTYYECNNQPSLYSNMTADTEKLKNSGVVTEEQKKEIENLINDYNNWKENEYGEKCFAPARQNRIVDALTMIIIALPICLTHWFIIKKDKIKKENE